MLAATCGMVRFMSTSNCRYSEKKAYSTPTCQSKTVSEIAAVFRNSFFDKSGARISRSSETDFAGPVLLITKCLMTVNAIAEAAEKTGICLRQTTRGEPVRAYQMTARRTRAPGFHGALLFLDLRKTRKTAAEVLKQSNGGCHRTDIPAAILVSDVESQVGQAFRAGRCWQMKGPEDPFLLMRGLSAFWELWTHALTCGLPRANRALKSAPS